MSDENLRKLERTYKETCSLDDGLEWGMAALRCGEVKSGLEPLEALYVLDPDNKKALDGVVSRDRFAIEFQPEDNSKAVRLYNVSTRVSGSGNLEKRTYDWTLAQGTHDSDDIVVGIQKYFELPSIHEYHACIDALRSADNDGTVSKELIKKVKELFLDDFQKTAATSTMVGWAPTGEQGCVMQAHGRDVSWNSEGDYVGPDGIVRYDTQLITDLFGATNDCDLKKTYSWFAGQDVQLEMIRRSTHPANLQMGPVSIGLEKDNIQFSMMSYEPDAQRGIKIVRVPNKPSQGLLERVMGRLKSLISLT